MSNLCRSVLLLTILCFPIAQAISSEFLGVAKYLKKYDLEIKNQDIYHVSAIF